MNSPVTKIYKFVLGTTSRFNDSKLRILSMCWAFCQLQDGSPVMWATVWPESTKRKYVILCKMTGDDIVGATSFLGTVQLKNGIVLHYFGGGPGL